MTLSVRGKAMSKPGGKIPGEHIILFDDGEWRIIAEPIPQFGGFYGAFFGPPSQGVVIHHKHDDKWVLASRYVPKDENMNNLWHQGWFVTMWDEGVKVAPNCRECGKIIPQEVLNSREFFNWSVDRSQL